MDKSERLDSKASSRSRLIDGILVEDIDVENSKFKINLNTNPDVKKKPKKKKEDDSSCATN